jgi:site-specific recombinase XerD
MTAEHEKLFKEYEQDARARYREQTYLGLRRDAKKVIEYVEGLGLGLGELTVRQAQGYQGYLLERGRKRDGGAYARSSVLNRLTAAVTLYEFLKRRGMVRADPFRAIRKVRDVRPLPRNIPKEKELNEFLEALGRYDECGSLREKKMRYRMHVLAELMYATGLRVSEAAALQPSDIDFARSVVNVREGKGGYARTAFLTEYAREVLRLYVDKLRPLVLNEHNRNRREYLFGAGWSNFRRTVNRYLGLAAKEAGLAKFTSHCFRHALGYHLLRAGCNIRHIQEILGHRHLKHTEVYTKVDKEDLRAVLDECHPRSFHRVR